MGCLIYYKLCFLHNHIDEFPQNCNIVHYKFGFLYHHILCFLMYYFSASVRIDSSTILWGFAVLELKKFLNVTLYKQLSEFKRLYDIRVKWVLVKSAQTLWNYRVWCADKYLKTVKIAPQKCVAKGLKIYSRLKWALFYLILTNCAPCIYSHKNTWNSNIIFERILPEPIFN